MLLETRKLAHARNSVAINYAGVWSELFSCSFPHHLARSIRRKCCRWQSARLESRESRGDKSASASGRGWQARRKPSVPARQLQLALEQPRTKRSRSTRRQVAPARLPDKDGDAQRAGSGICGAIAELCRIWGSLQPCIMDAAWTCAPRFRRYWQRDAGLQLGIWARNVSSYRPRRRQRKHRTTRRRLRRTLAVDECRKPEFKSVIRHLAALD